MNRIVLFNCSLEPIILLEARGRLAPESLNALNGTLLQMNERAAIDSAARSLGFDVLTLRTHSVETHVLVTYDILAERAVRRILDDAVRHAQPGADYLAATLGLYP